MPAVTSRITDPPLPPLPPSGPPRALYGSECIDTEPSPPRPEVTYSVHSSTKAMGIG